MPPLWTPPTRPRELFPEWPTPATLAAENWGSEDALYEDPSPPTVTGDVALWKRPRQFLPPIAEPTAGPASAPLAPVVPDPKHAKKAAPAPTAKKGELEPPKKPRAPSYAYIVYTPHDDKDQYHHQTPHPTIPAPTADPRKSAPPATPSAPTPTASPPPPRRITRDFRRLWDSEQEGELVLWEKEERRIEKEQEQHERVYMEFEDATAFIVNERPRLPLNDESVDPEDLEDDGEDENYGDEGPPVALDNSPYGGILPPAKIEIPGNAIVKPEIPHGQVVYPEFASYYRVVDQLWETWSKAPNAQVPYLWESIFPQDQHGVPIYTPGGKYSVRLFVAGKWRRVDVDDKFPVDQDGYISLATSGMRNELWAAILTKALMKVAMWLGVYDEHDRGSVATRLASSMITALTGLKVSLHRSDDVFKGELESILKYIPHPQCMAGVQNELLIDEGDEAALEPEEQPDTKPTQSEIGPPKPRMFLCCTSADGLDGHLLEREAALLVDVVGDAGNLTLKVISLNGASSVPEETLSPHCVSFLVIHPPSRSADLLFHHWSTDSTGSIVPYSNPPVQHCVVMGLKATEQAPGDHPSEVATNKNIEHEVNVVLTLNRFPPENNKVDTGDAIAKHLHVDPHRSAILIEDLALQEYRSKHSEEHKTDTSRPKVFKIDTESSLCIRLSRSEIDSVGFRLYPQPSLRYGYSLQVESSDAKSDWQVSSTYWRNVWDLQVIDADGAYPAMQANSWNILFKQSVELSPAAEGPPGDAELYVDLHLSDFDLAASVHVYIVSQAVDKPIILSGLYGRAKLPTNCNHATLIVECSPRRPTPEGKWHLTLGSNRFFKLASIHQPRLTTFDGQYEPNKPLVCLRDVIVQPKSPMTSFQFELLGAGGANGIESLAAKLEVIDSSTGESQAQVSGRGLVRLLQLPATTDDKPGFILQASIDKSCCQVPESLRSVRPYSFKKAQEGDTPKENPIVEESQAGSVGSSSAPRTPGPGGTSLRWILSCWSVEEVKLEFDRTEELRHEAIRTSWNETAKDRDAHGVSSRAYFLGKPDVAEAAMTEDGLSEEQIAKYKARVEWLHQATQHVSGCDPHDHIDIQVEREPTDERVWSADDLAQQEQVLATQASAIAELQQCIRDQRLVDNEARSNELKDMVQWCKDTRREADQLCAQLVATRDELRQQTRAS